MKSGIKPAVRHLQNTTTLFTLFYMLFVLVPNLFFIGRYSVNTVNERHREQEYEMRMFLRQSTKFFGNYLQQAQYMRDSLQANQALIQLLDNSYLNISDELYAYNTSIFATTSGLMSANPTIFDMHIYKKKESLVEYGNLTSLFLNMEDLQYDSDIIDQINGEGHTQHIRTEPLAEEIEIQDIHYPARIICLYPLFNSSYDETIAILELHLDLEIILAGMNLSDVSNKLYIRQNTFCIPITKGNEYPLLPYVDVVNDLKKYTALTESVDDTEFELVYFISQENMTTEVFMNLLFSAFILLAPATLLWHYIYKYTRRLHQFSKHIRKSREPNLIPYEEDKKLDELGTLVSEYNRLIKTVNELINSVRQAEMLKNEAHYYAMNSQINPHFMFNTLENIRMYIELGDKKSASDIILAFSSFIRYNITLRHKSTLFEELDHIKRYLQIYQYRKSNRISYQVSLDKNVHNISCPFFIFQPIIENCMKHGMKGMQSMPLFIEVNVKLHEAGVEVIISDNGVGMNKTQIETINAKMKQPISYGETEPKENRVGLNNVNNRIRYFYGNNYGISFSEDAVNQLSCHILLGNSQ